MTTKGFSFNGTTTAQFETANSCGFIVTDVRRGASSDDLSTADVSGKNGSIVLGSRSPARVIEVDFHMHGSTAEAMTDAEGALVAWFKPLADPADPSGYPLLFDDDTGKQFFARYLSMSVHDGGTYRDGTISFAAPDPYKYETAETSADLAVGDATVTNTGGVETFPHIFVPVLGNATYVEAICGDKRVLVGTPSDVAQTPTEKYTSVLYDDCSSTSGWSLGTSSQDGIVAGTMTSNGSTLSPKWDGGSFDTGSAWHGPTLRRGLSTPAANWRAEAQFRFHNDTDPYVAVVDESVTLSGTTAVTLAHASVDGSQVTSIVVKNTAGTTKYSTSDDYTITVSAGSTRIARKTGSDIATGATVKVSYKYLVGRTGRVEMYLLDTNGVRVGRIGISDPYSTLSDSKIYASAWKAGVGTSIINGVFVTGETPGEYNDYDGIMQLVKVGSEIHARFARKDLATGKLYKSYTSEPLTIDGLENVAMVEVHMARYGLYSPVDELFVAHVKVDAINDSIPNTPDIIAAAGDIVEIDCEYAAVRVNGSPLMAALNIGSRFFPLPAGDSIVTVHSDAPVDSPYATFRRRWL